MKKNQPTAQPVIEIDPLKGAEQHAEIPVGEYTIHMALAEATEKYRNSIRPIDRRTIYRAAQTILREKQAATQLPRRFEGENEYQAWLESQGLMESDDYGYVSQTRTKNISELD